MNPVDTEEATKIETPLVDTLKKVMKRMSKRCEELDVFRRTCVQVMGEAIENCETCRTVVVKSGYCARCQTFAMLILEAKKS